MTNPANWLLVVPGLATLLVSERMKRFRPLGIAFALLLVGVLFSGQRRGDRIAGVYPIVFAAGAVAWEHVFGLLRDGRERGRWASMLGLRRSAAPWRRPGVWGLQAAIPISILALGALLLPISLPIFAPARVEAFFKAIDERPAIETGDVDQWLPLTLSGRLGWRRFSEEVYAAVDRLPVELRERSVLLTPHWLYASVLEYYGRERGGPPVVSPHNAYAFWSGSADDRDQVITVAISRERVDSIFGESRELAIFRCEVCTAWRGDLPIRLAPAPAGDGLSELLERWRFYSIGRVPALTP